MIEKTMNIFTKSVLAAIILLFFITESSFSQECKNCTDSMLDRYEKQKVQILLSSICSPNISSELDMMWTTPSADNFYHLANGSLWQDYIFENGFFLIQNTSSYKRVNVYPPIPVKVERTPIGFCKLKYDGKEIYVRRIY